VSSCAAGGLFEEQKKLSPIFPTLFVIRQPGNMMQQIANVDSPRVRRELGAILVKRVVEFN
jgi:hypothetical protein